MPRGSQTQDEMAARMRDVGYEEWEIQDEIEQAEKLTRENAENTRLFRETGRFKPSDPPILRGDREVIEDVTRKPVNTINPKPLKSDAFMKYVPTWLQMLQMPPGWQFTTYDDGSGSIKSADGIHHIDFDMQTGEIGDHFWPGASPEEIASAIQHDIEQMPGAKSEAPLTVFVSNPYKLENGKMRCVAVGLPATDEEIDTTLRAAGVYDPVREHMFIEGVQVGAAEQVPSEQGDLFGMRDMSELHHLNLLAEQIALEPDAAGLAIASYHSGHPESSEAHHGLSERYNALYSADSSMEEYYGFEEELGQVQDNHLALHLAPAWLQQLRLPAGWHFVSYDDQSGRIVDAKGNVFIDFDTQNGKFGDHLWQDVAPEEIASNLQTEINQVSSDLKEPALTVLVTDPNYLEYSAVRCVAVGLPATAEEIDAVLRSSGVYEPEHEEIVLESVRVAGPQGWSFGDRELFGEVDISELSDLNLLAKQIELEPGAASRVIDLHYGSHPDSIEELMNNIAQADQIRKNESGNIYLPEYRFTLDDLRESIEPRWELAQAGEPLQIHDRLPEDMEGYAETLDALRTGPAQVNLDTGEVLSVYPAELADKPGQPFVAKGDPQYLAKLIVCANDLTNWAQEQIGRHNVEDGMPADAITNKSAWHPDGTVELNELAKQTLGDEGMRNLAEHSFESQSILEACKEAREAKADLQQDVLSPNEESERLKGIKECMAHVAKKAKERLAPTI